MHSGEPATVLLADPWQACIRGRFRLRIRHTPRHDRGWAERFWNSRHEGDTKAYMQGAAAAGPNHQLCRRQLSRLRRQCQERERERCRSCAAFLRRADCMRRVCCALSWRSHEGTCWRPLLGELWAQCCICCCWCGRWRHSLPPKAALPWLRRRGTPRGQRQRCPGRLAA